MYNKEYRGDVCSHTHSYILDNMFRRLLQNPVKIVGEYLKEGDLAIDLGCGPGYFSIDMAKLVGGSGKVFAVDLQKEMLEKARKKAKGRNLEGRMVFHHCPQDRIGLSADVKADFILAFYMVHETPDPEKFLSEVRSLLKPQGKFLLVEPTFHVSKKQFQEMACNVERIGFKSLGSPSKKGGRSLLLTAA